MSLVFSKGRLVGLNPPRLLPLTISPSSGVALVVNGAAGAILAQFTGAASNNAEVRLTGGSGVTNGLSLVSEQGTSDAYVIQRDAANLFLRTNNVNRIQISSAGNVTVNAPSSGAALDVTGNTTITSGSNNTLGVTGNVGTAPAGVDAGQVVALGNTATTGADKRFMSFGQIGGDAFIRALSVGAGPTAAGLRFNVGNGDRLYIDTSGRIGHGTLTPSSWYGNDAWVVHARDQNAETIFGLQNATSGASASLSLRLVGGTANSFSIFRLNDNSATPTYDFAFGSAVTSVRWQMNGVAAMTLNQARNFVINAPSSGTALTLPASATSGASLNIPHGAAPTTPANGDIWTTTAGFFVRVNGATVPLGGGGAGPGTLSAAASLAAVRVATMQPVTGAADVTGMTWGAAGGGFGVPLGNPAGLVRSALPSWSNSAGSSTSSATSQNGGEAAFSVGGTVGSTSWGGFYVRFLAAPVNNTPAHGAYISFFGLRTQLSPGIEPDDVTAGNVVGMGLKSTDTNWCIYHGTPGSYTRIDLGASFPKRNGVSAVDDVFELILSCLPGASSMTWSVRNLQTGASSSGTISSNMPNSTSAGRMSPIVNYYAGGVSATATAVAVYGFYSERY